MPRNRVQISLQTSVADTIIDSILDTSSAKSLHLLNSYNIGLAMIDQSYGDVLENATYNVVDGRVFLRTLKFWQPNGRALHLRGVDFLRRTLETSSNSNRNSQKHFFLGSTELVLGRIHEYILENHPQIEMESYSPPFTDYSAIDFEEIATRVENFLPDVVWVGLGTPKQDYMVQRIRNECGVSAIAIGAAFDFLVGNKIESKKILQLLGLEWLHRLIEEPARLWRRYFLISPISFFYPARVKINFFK